jgi:hypothetical protein
MSGIGRIMEVRSFEVSSLGRRNALDIGVRGLSEHLEYSTR